MIKVKLLKDNNKIKKIIIGGHALYDDFGKDIVCAAVSSTVITSINASLLIDSNSLIYDDKDGLTIVIIKNTDKMYKNRVHIFNDNGKLMNEKAYISTFFETKPSSI